MYYRRYSCLSHRDVRQKVEDAILTSFPAFYGFTESVFSCCLMVTAKIGLSFAIEAAGGSARDDADCP